MLYIASQVNPDDILKLENRQADTVFDDSGDMSDNEEDERDDHEMTETDDEQEGGGDREDTDEKENDTDMETKETDKNVAAPSGKKVKVTKKPKGTEYKLIR